MSGDETTASEALRAVERAMQDLICALAKIDLGLDGTERIVASRRQIEHSLKDQHADLANILREQHSVLTKIMDEALAEMERLKGTRSD